MSGSRWIVVGTALAVGASVLLFIAGGWGRVGDLAGALAALVAVAGLGASLWSARTGRNAAASRRVEVSDTGNVRGTGVTSATTGAWIEGDAPDEVRVHRTGSVENADGVTGYRQQRPPRG